MEMNMKMMLVPAPAHTAVFYNPDPKTGTLLEREPVVAWGFFDDEDHAEAMVLTPVGGTISFASEAGNFLGVVRNEEASDTNALMEFFSEQIEEIDLKFPWAKEAGDKARAVPRA
jgi:hypothetical protein